MRELETGKLSASNVAAIRDMLAAAFGRVQQGGFTWDDWLRALGGTHFLLEDDGRVVGHASVTPGELHVDGRPVETGYVKAVAIEPAMQRQGLGSRLMAAVSAHIDAGFELGALATDSQPFYERLGWEIWQGPTFVRLATGMEATPGADGHILIRRTRCSPLLRLSDPISCEWDGGASWYPLSEGRAARQRRLLADQGRSTTSDRRPLR
jgi:aminoglycoside 2'-N-acetyltransferase I